MTKEALFPDFPREEYLARWRRAREAIKAAGMDALLLSNQENLRYFAGFHQGAWECKHFYFFLLLPADETIPPVLLFANGFQHQARCSWVEEVRHWKWQKAFYMSHETNAVPLIAEVLREKGLDGGTIGMELGANMHLGMGARHFDDLRQAVARAQIVDGTDAIWSVRAIKSPAEIERLREAARISCLGVKAGFEALRAGVTERQIAGVMHEAMFGAGATRTGLMCVYGGPRLMWADSTPSDYAFRKGDVIQFDGGIIYEGYWCDFKRMAAIGEPTAEQRRHFELACRGLERALETMGPGVASRDVFHAAFAVNNEAGYGDFSAWCLENGWSAIGHSLGLNIHEHPGISAASPAVLEPGMVFAVEPYITLGGKFPFWDATEKYGLEDNVVVTADGIEMLTKEEYVTHDLWIA
ncbi:MAG: M24 family metallopeptidase [Bryobacteraceae bacterium]